MIESMLSEENIAAAIGEVLSAFENAYGETDLEVFTRLLGDRLTERNRSDAANMLLTWKPPSRARR